MTKGSKMLKRTEAASLRKERMTWKRQFCKGTNFAKTKKIQQFCIFGCRCMNACCRNPSKGNIWKGERYLEELVAS